DGLLAYQGLSANDVLPLGHQVLLDYRYNNCWLKMNWGPDNVLPTCGMVELREQLEDAGKVLWKEIPESVRQDTMYTLDAILDSRDCLWWLEMNSNPQVHPDVYLPMLRDLFARVPSQQRAGEPPSPSPPGMPLVQPGPGSHSPLLQVELDG